MTALATAVGPTFLDGALDSMATGVNIPELYNIMANKPNLVGALGNMPFSYDNKPIVKNRQISLTGHHLYGSSRLGIAGYWPGQIARSWDYINSTIDTFRLCGNQAWYSGSYNDVIEKGKTTPYGFGVQSPFLSTHLRGQKQYELTNHLGNVQATVSDARYVISDQPSQPYRSNIIAAYDYYPFGMLMPKRFVTDTAMRSAAVTRTITVPQVVTNNIDLTTAVKESSYATMTATSSLVTLTGQGGNVYFMASVAPMGSTIVKVSINYMLGPLVLQVSEYRSGGWFNLKTQPINYPGIATTQAFIPTTNSIRIKVLTDMMYEASSTQFTISNVQVLSNGLVPQNIVANITNVDKNRYEFGFNGKTKDNEIAGVGNSLDFGARVYDSRIARWKSLDPLASKYPSMSPYSFSGNSPITFGDYDGKDFGVIINSDPNVKTIVVVATVYTIDDKTTKQAQAAANLWNAKSAIVDGYTVTFQVKVEQAPTVSREELLAKSKTVYNKDGSINELAVQQRQRSVAQQNGYNLIATNKIGNLYRGNYPGIAVYDGSDFEGGATLGKQDIYMNTHYDLNGGRSKGDMGQYPDITAHEFGHLFGLNDEGNGIYFSQDGIMKYQREEGKPQKPISDGDVSDVIRFAHDQYNQVGDTNDPKVTIISNTGGGTNPITTQ